MNSAERATNLGTLLAGVPGAQLEGCTSATGVSGLVMDSRQARPGCAFLAMAGDTVDGHDFVAAARARGATVVVVGQAGQPPIEPPWVRLPDTRRALPQLAANLFGHPGRALAMAGITGTNGKTTTAHLLGAVLERAGLPYVRLGTTGNWLVDHDGPAGFTTPFPLELQALLRQALDAGARHGIMEVSSHALAQQRVGAIPFRAVGLTSFGQDHLDFHPNMAAYLAAKCQLAGDHLATDGVAVAAVDGQLGARPFLEAARQGGARAWRASRGADPAAEIHVVRARVNADGIQLEVVSPAGPLSVRSPLVGGFNVDNLLVTVGLALGLEIAPPHICQGLERATGAPGRLERVKIGASGPRVFVDYAHTPDAVRNVLEALRPLTGGRLIVVLGCGGDRDRSKRPLMGKIAVAGSDQFFATSDNPRTESPEQIVDQMLEGISQELGSRVVRQVDRSTAIADAIAGAQANDTVLLAGKGHEDYQILGTEKIHFDDREHAVRALQARA